MSRDIVAGNGALRHRPNPNEHSSPKSADRNVQVGVYLPHTYDPLQ